MSEFRYTPWGEVGGCRVTHVESGLFVSLSRYQHGGAWAIGHDNGRRFIAELWDDLDVDDPNDRAAAVTRAEAALRARLAAR